MATHAVTVIPGDGIGREVIDAARGVLDATGVRFDWDVQEAGEGVAEREGEPLPERVLDAIRSTRVALKGPITAPIDAPYRSANVELRVALDLYACVRPCRSLPGVRSPYEGIDLVVVRENTEDLYTGLEFEQGDPDTKALIELIAETTGQTIREDSGLSIKSISAGGSDRIARFAFALAGAEGRTRVTAGHKANIMKLSDGLFVERARAVAAEHPGIVYEERIVDNLAMQLVQRPEAFDVILLPNLYGDIVSDLCAGLVGGLGIAPGANLGDELAVFEPLHGSAPDLAGLDRANPIAAIRCGAMLLRHLGEAEAADRVERAVESVLAEGRWVTADLRPSPDDPSAATTSEVADAVAERARR
jgi:isocitrate dehydrogenase (NAD+)